MKKKKLQISIISAFVFIMAGTIFLCTWQTSCKRKENMFQESVTEYKSEVDRDKDGINDQKDILESALNYIETEPVYKSQYYKGKGYPDDKHGVCTDVVAFSLLHTGYDLRTLVNQHILENKDLYEITEPDIDIDFRRVKNLRVFFDDTAIKLTTDLEEIEQWQGGDIVVFENHIGVVSDRRNERGIPYVIHHNGYLQIRYEEDILEKRKDIVGHYRIS